MSKPFWRTALSAIEPNKILIRGYRVEELMERCSFGDVIYLTFTGELPKGNEGRILEMIAVSSTAGIIVPCVTVVLGSTSLRAVAGPPPTPPTRLAKSLAEAPVPACAPAAVAAATAAAAGAGSWLASNTTVGDA